MPESPGIAELYALGHASFDEFARTLSDDDWLMPLPCTPVWTARDVLSHVAGIPDDAFAGRMEGAPGEAWTAAQVERNRHAGVDELLDRWSEHSSRFADMIESMGDMRPVFDLHSHEHDLRQALGRPGQRSSLIVETAGFALASVGGVDVRLTVALDDGRIIVSGDPDSAVAVDLRSVTVFELFRSRLGRRGRGQVRSYDWTGSDVDIDTVLGSWFIFGPSLLPIDE